MENLIIHKLITNSDYSKSIIPFLSKDYFGNKKNIEILEVFMNHYKNFHKNPTYDEIIFDLNKKIKNPETFKEYEEHIEFELIKADKEIINKKLISETENYFKNISVQNAVIKCATELNDDNYSNYDHFIETFKGALNVSFDESMGLEYFNKDDVIARYNSYIQKPEKIELGTKAFNQITDGGFERKTLNIYMSPTNVGKTWKLIDDAASLIRSGYNVLYITLEMSREKIMQRIEANLFELPTALFDSLTLKEYSTLVKNTNKDKKLGKLFVNDFPTGAASILHFNNLLNEYELKKNFKPDVILIDYLAIMKPLDERFANSYERDKLISEELRSLAFDHNCCVISAIQTNREGYSNSDFDLRSTSGSIGVPFTADFIAGLIRDQDIEENDEMFIKVMKNRYSTFTNKKFTIGINILHQKFLDVEQDDGSDLHPDKVDDDRKRLIEQKNKTMDKFKSFKF